ncbi:hypothetical protein CRUP_000718 [Coryphaenoides rupestris]|nr:hypothetical protein CRUP_000718 [Coryphaenoides rupestris]
MAKQRRTPQVRPVALRSVANQDFRLISVPMTTDEFRLALEAHWRPSDPPTGVPGGPGGPWTTVGAHKLQPCLLELCKFFSQCLCRPNPSKNTQKRYCDDSDPWYRRHTAELCARLKRVAFSRSSSTRAPCGRFIPLRQDVTTYLARGRGRALVQLTPDTQGPRTVVGPRGAPKRRADKTQDVTTYLARGRGRALVQLTPDTQGPRTVVGPRGAPKRRADKTQVEAVVVVVVKVNVVVVEVKAPVMFLPWMFLLAALAEGIHQTSIFCPDPTTGGDPGGLLIDCLGQRFTWLHALLDNFPSLVNFAARLRCVAGICPRDLEDYGCSCRHREAGEPQDPLDSCCLDHRRCYEAVMAAPCRLEVPPLVDNLTCTTLNSTCEPPGNLLLRPGAHCWYGRDDPAEPPQQHSPPNLFILLRSLLAARRQQGAAVVKRETSAETLGNASGNVGGAADDVTATPGPAGSEYDNATDLSSNQNATAFNSSYLDQVYGLLSLDGAAWNTSDITDHQGHGDLVTPPPGAPSERPESEQEEEQEQQESSWTRNQTASQHLPPPAHNPLGSEEAGAGSQGWRGPSSMDPSPSSSRPRRPEPSSEEAESATAPGRGSAERPRPAGTSGPALLRPHPSSEEEEGEDDDDDDGGDDDDDGGGDVDEDDDKEGRTCDVHLHHHDDDNNNNNSINNYRYHGDLDNRRPLQGGDPSYTHRPPGDHHGDDDGDDNDDGDRITLAAPATAHAGSPAHSL